MKKELDGWTPFVDFNGPREKGDGKKGKKGDGKKGDGKKGKGKKGKGKKGDYGDANAARAKTGGSIQEFAGTTKTFADSDSD